MLNLKIKNIMKTGSIIIAVLTTAILSMLAIQCVIHCTFGIAVVFAIMAIASGYMTYCEIKEIE